MREITLYECQVCGCLYYDMQGAIECESLCILEGLAENNIVYLCDNRKEAYEMHIEYESGFDYDDNPYLEMSYEEFCEELDKGYGKSDCIQIARLYEDSHGGIWYDNDYCG